ncbi:MAG TPA: hypothetical protein VH439_17235 [Gemmatimonadales bacterium]|jgi:hypothetical protein
MQTLATIAPFSADEQAVLLKALRSFTMDGPYPDEHTLNGFSLTWAKDCAERALAIAGKWGPVDEDRAVLRAVLERIVAALPKGPRTWTEFTSRCRFCHRIFRISAEAIMDCRSDDDPEDATNDAEIANGIDVCLECATGEPVQGEKPSYRLHTYYPIGTRVRFRRTVDRYPHFVARAGLTGVVTDAGDEIGGTIAVKVDTPLAGAEAWNNEVWWTEPEERDEIGNDLEVIALAAPMTTPAAPDDDDDDDTNEDEPCYPICPRCNATTYGAPECPDCGVQFDMPSTDWDMWTLEALIDRSGLPAVLDAMADVAEAKGRHAEALGAHGQEPSPLQRTVAAEWRLRASRLRVAADESRGEMIA